VLTLWWLLVTEMDNLVSSSYSDLSDITLCYLAEELISILLKLNIIELLYYFRMYHNCKNVRFFSETQCILVTHHAVS